MALPQRPRRRDQPPRILSAQEEDAIRLVNKREAMRRWYAALPLAERAKTAAMTVYVAHTYRIVAAGTGWFKAINPFDDCFYYAQEKGATTHKAQIAVVAQSEGEVRSLMAQHHPTWPEAAR